jgi:hypothetical protein
MLSSGMKRYHLELMLSSGTTCYHLGLHVIIWDAMLSSGANVIIWDKMLSSGATVIMISSGANVIIWCYHVMLSSLFLFFLKTSLTLNSGVNVLILASTSVPFTLTTVQVPNLALSHTKRITL